MEVNAEFYVDWFRWAEARAAQLVHHDPFKLLAFSGELAALVKLDVALFKSLGECVHGPAWSIAVKVGSWVSEHPDPLQPSREAMRGMREKYGEVAANA